MSVPLIATAPGLRMRRLPSTVMTMPLVMMSETAAGCCAATVPRAAGHAIAAAIVSASAIAGTRIVMQAELYVNP